MHRREAKDNKMELAIDKTARALASLGHAAGGKDHGPTKGFQLLIKNVGEAKTKHVSRTVLRENVHIATFRGGLTVLACHYRQWRAPWPCICCIEVQVINTVNSIGFGREVCEFWLKASCSKVLHVYKAELLQHVHDTCTAAIGTVNKVGKENPRVQWVLRVVEWLAICIVLGSMTLYICWYLQVVLGCVHTR